MAFSAFGTWVAKYNSSLPTLTDGTFAYLQTTVNGELLVKVNTALPTGSNAIGSITNLFALDATLAKLTIAQGTALGSNTQALMGASVTTAAPTYTTGQISPLSMDTAGNLRVSSAASANTLGSQTTTTGTITTSSSAITASSTTSYGSFLVTVQGTYAGVNFGFFASDDAGVTYYPIQAVRLDSFVSETTTGVLTSNTSRAWIVSVGGATNFKVLASAYTSGTANIRITPSADTYTQAVTVGGTVNATQSGTWNITNISGTVSLPTGAATETSLARLTLAIGSTTSGSFGPMVQGAVTTAAPTYTTAQNDPLSLKTTGSLRTEMSEWIGSTAPTVGSKTSANSIPVVVASDQGAISVTDSQTITDNAAFTDGTSKLFTSGFIFDETAGTALTENDAAAGRVDSKRAIVFALEDATTRGQRATVSAAGALKVDASATTINVDKVYEPGTNADTTSNSGTGTLVSIATGGFTDLATLAVGAGVTAFTTGLTFSADQECQVEFVEFNGTTVTTWYRSFIAGGAVPTVSMTFPLAIKKVGSATHTVKIRAQALQVAANGMASINAYTR